MQKETNRCGQCDCVARTHVSSLEVISFLVSDKLCSVLHSGRRNKVNNLFIMKEGKNGLSSLRLSPMHYSWGHSINRTPIHHQELIADTVGFSPNRSQLEINLVMGFCENNLNADLKGLNAEKRGTD